MLRLGSSLGSKVRSCQAALRLKSSVAGYADTNVEIKESPFKDFGYNNHPSVGMYNPACNVFEHYEWHSCVLPVYKYSPVMSQAMYGETLKAPVARANVRELNHGIDIAFTAVRDHMMRCSSKLVSSSEELIQVGTLATNGDRQIGELVAKAIEKCGHEGAFMISDKVKSNNELVFDKGMSLDWGLISPYYINNNGEQSCVLRNPLILIHENKISSGEILLVALESDIEFNNRPLLVITEDMKMKEISNLILDWNFVGLEVYVTKPVEKIVYRKGIMQDLAVLTGGQVHTVGKLVIFGSCKEVSVTSDSMVILGGSGRQENIEERCEQLRSAIKSSTSVAESELLEGRLEKLYRGAAVFKVRGDSKAEVRSNNKKIRNALEASKVAMEDGIVPGGGATLLHASKVLDELRHPRSDVMLGIQLFQHALKMPVYSIASNAGFDGSTIVKKLMEQENSNIGFNPTTGEYVDMFKAGNVDPSRMLLDEMMALIYVFKNYTPRPSS